MPGEQQPARDMRPARSAPAPTPADREARHPLYRYTMHLGLPVSVSLLVHVGVLVLLGMKTLGIILPANGGQAEYAASVVDSPADTTASKFDWSEPTPPPTGDLTPGPPMDDLLNQPIAKTDLAALQTGAHDDPNAAASLGDGALAVLGTGSGAGAPGTGGFGGALGEGGGQLGQAGIWNLNVRANKVVYVVDFSGSIIVAVDELKHELKRSIGRLQPGQLFDVIIFYSVGGGTDERVRTESFRPQLEPATEKTRRDFFTWLDSKAPRGGTQPLEALQRALALGPDAVFFFSDGYFEDELVGQISAANRQTRARIYAVVFDDQLLGDNSGLAPRDTDGSRRLRRIAEANGGQVKLVTAKDLPRR